MANSTLVAKKADNDDAEKIFQLIQPYVKDSILLPRSLQQIKEEINNTWVCFEENTLLGVVNLTAFSSVFFEVRGLAVHETAQGRGIGRILLQAMIEHMHTNMPGATLFALTYVPKFFYSLGFVSADKAEFPAKIYQVCKYCNKKDDCQEIAVKLQI